MAGRTIVVNDTRRMVEGSRESRVVVTSDKMACRAVQASRQMASRFTFADIAIMASQAIAGISARVIKQHACKAGGYMASVAIQEGIGRYMIRQFAHTDHIVVAGVARTHERRAGMIKGASAEGAGGMANLAILGGRHVLVERGAERFTCRGNAVTGIAVCGQYDRVSVVDAKCRAEFFCVMARTTIGAGD